MAAPDDTPRRSIILLYPHLQNAAWEQSTENLTFRFGPWVFGKWRFASLTNRTNPLLQENGSVQVPPVTQPVTFQQMLDQGNITRTIFFDRGAICYIPYRGERYFIDLCTGDFNDYMKKFSKKARYNLTRTVRQFAEQSGGSLDVRCYRSPVQMAEFCQHAAAISRLTYQHKIGFGFPEAEEFTKELIEEAEDGRVRGFVLAHNNQPTSYALCRINYDVITYSLIGYDPRFIRLSPGKVLLHYLIEKMFAEHTFRLFDFGGQYWDYKAHYATSSISYLRVIWFPKTAKNLSLVVAHYLLLQAWRAASELKRISASRSGRITSIVSYFRKQPSHRMQA